MIDKQRRVKIVGCARRRLTCARDRKSAISLTEPLTAAASRRDDTGDEPRHFPRMLSKDEMGGMVQHVKLGAIDDRGCLDVIGGERVRAME